MTIWCKIFNSIDGILEGHAIFLCDVEGQFNVNIPVHRKFL
jgi:hypothetical protein